MVIDKSRNAASAQSSPQPADGAANCPVEQQTETNRILWQIFNIPEDLQMEAEKAFILAPKPLVYESKWEDVKITETVQKKVGLFAVKNEQVVKIIKRESKISKQITSPPVAKGFIDEGAVICTLPPLASKRKKNKEFGESGDGGLVDSTMSLQVGSIDTKSGDETESGDGGRPALALGKGVTRRGDQLIAQVTGFIRRGENWVDIIPYVETTFIVYPAPNGKHCYLDFVPGTTLWPIPKEIIDNALELHFKIEDLLSEKEIEQILDDARKKYKPLKKIPLMVPKDAGFELNISKDKMRATLSLRKGKGVGKPLDLSAIGKIILKAGLQGMDIKKIQADVLAFYRGPQQELIDYPLVAGRTSVSGKDGELRYLVEFLAPEVGAGLRQKLEKNLGPTEKLSFTVTGASASVSPSVPNNASVNRRVGIGTTSVSEPVIKIDFPLKLVEKFAYVIKDQKVAELIPASPGQAGKDVYGNVIPCSNGNNPDLKVLEGLQFSKNVLLVTKSGLLLIGKSGESILARVFEYREGQIQLDISPDNLFCYISLFPPAGGEPITIDMLKAELAQRGIKQGVDEPLLAQLVAKVQTGQNVTGVLLAKGQPPVNKAGSQLIFHCQVAAGKVLYRLQEETNQPRSIKKDELIAEIKNISQPSRSGWDIMGKTLEPQEENPLKIEVGKNVKCYQAQDGTIKYYALAGGEVYYNGHLLEVKDKLSLERSLAPGSGDINFSGSVEVKGDVKAGCRIFSGADIIIEGLSEEAVLSAEGSIEVKKGVKGQGKAILRAKHGIITPYVERAVILAVGDIKIAQSCLHCQIKCNSKLFLNGGTGTLVGGIIKAKKGLETEALGSNREVKTFVSFGQDYLVEDQIEGEEREIEKLKRIIYEADLKMHKLENDKAANQLLLNNLRSEKLKALKLMEKRSIRLFNLKEKFEEHFPSEIVIRGVLHPGVVFESHGRTYEVKTKKEKLVIFFNTEVGKIQEKLLK